MAKYCYFYKKNNFSKIHTSKTSQLCFNTLILTHLSANETVVSHVLYKSCSCHQTAKESTSRFKMWTWKEIAWIIAVWKKSPRLKLATLFMGSFSSFPVHCLVPLGLHFPFLNPRGSLYPPLSKTDTLS